MKRKFIVLLAVCWAFIIVNTTDVVANSDFLPDAGGWVAQEVDANDKYTNESADSDDKDIEEFRNKLNKTFTGVVEKVGPAVVSIKAKFDWGEGEGSGVIVLSDGYILTNDHIITHIITNKITGEITGYQANEVWIITGDKRKFLAKICGSDPETDLAELKIDAADLPYIKFANPNSLKVGEIVIAIGAPFGFRNSVSGGIISALGRESIGANTTFNDYIQTDAAINPGNSGGPLVNLKGELIGINTAIIAGPFGGFQGVGFAISVSIVESVFQQLKEHGRVRRGWLGIAGMDMEMFRGIIEGYNVAFNDKDCLNNLREKIKDNIEYLRLGSPRLESPQDGFHKRSPHGHGGKGPSPADILRKIESLEDLLRFFNSPNFQETISSIDIQTATGVFVRGFDERESPAKNANIAVGDLILEVDGKPTPSVTDLLNIVAGIPSNKETLVKIRSGNTLKWVTVKVGERPPSEVPKSRDGGEEDNFLPRHPPMDPFEDPY